MCGSGRKKFGILRYNKWRKWSSKSEDAKLYKKNLDGNLDNTEDNTFCQSDTSTSNGKNRHSKIKSFTDLVSSLALKMVCKMYDEVTLTRKQIQYLLTEFSSLFSVSVQAFKDILLSFLNESINSNITKYVCLQSSN